MKKRNIDLRKFLNKHLHHRGWEPEDYEANAEFIEKERHNQLQTEYRRKKGIPIRSCRKYRCGN